MSSHDPFNDFRGNIINGVAKVDTRVTAGELERMLNEAPSGTTFQLAAGDYSFNDSITVNRSDISLVGAGADKTTLGFTDEALANDPTHSLFFQGSGTATAGPITTDAEEGSRTLSLENVSRLSEGDAVRIWQDNDPECFAAIGNTTWEGGTHSPLRTSMAKIESTEGGDVTLDRGVHFDFDAEEAKVQRYNTIENVSLEGVSLEYDLGTADPGAFANELPEFERFRAVEFDGTHNGHISDVEVIDGPSLAFEFNRSLDISADSLSAQGAINKGSGGNGYAYELRESYDGEYANLTDSGMRHSVLFASWRSSVGNDIHVDHTDRDINFHGGQDHDNIVEVEQSIRNPGFDKMSPTLWINQGGKASERPRTLKPTRQTFNML